MRKPGLYSAVALVLCLSLAAHRLLAEPTPPLSPEIPAKFQRPSDAADYDRREVMVAMRDGVKLFTVILVPRGARQLPILLTRTPYNAGKRAQRAVSNPLGATLPLARYQST